MSVRSARLRRAALSYVEHGWPVAPGAALRGPRFRCGPGCLTVSCHPLSPVRQARDRTTVRAWWRHEPWSVLLPTGSAVDAIDLPGNVGRLLLAVAPAGPVLSTPDGRWLFLVLPGDPLRPELATHADVVLHGYGVVGGRPAHAVPGGAHPLGRPAGTGVLAGARHVPGAGRRPDVAGAGHRYAGTGGRGPPRRLNARRRRLLTPWREIDIAGVT